MSLLVCDYSGHPFQIQLSRSLAARGHRVTHVFYSDFQTPKGGLELREDDPAGLQIRPVTLGRPFAKHSFIKRRRQELQVGDAIARVIEEVQPKVVLSSNAPLDTQRRIIRASRRQGAQFHFWLQDIYSAGITSVLSRKSGFWGTQVGRFYRHLEVAMLNASDSIIAISDDFTNFLHTYGISTPTNVVENWAPVELLDREVPVARDARCGKFRFLYSGTLGYKHNPELLLKLAERPGAEVHVYSEGPAADFLESEARRRGLAGTLRVAPWVPFEQLPAVLNAADALVALIEADAGYYSVPSKVLSYLCTGKPLLLSVPAENLAARIVNRENAGLVADPGNVSQFLFNASRLMSDSTLCRNLGLNGLAYARRTFDIQSISERFERILLPGNAPAGSPLGPGSCIPPRLAWS